MGPQGLATNPKKATRIGATICFVDQAGICEVPHVRRTWAPSGETPILHCRGHWTHVSLMGAITISPGRHHLNLYLQYYPARAVNKFDIITFIRKLMRHVFNPIILIVDRGNIHRAGEVQEFLASHPRVSMEYLPSYAPELNPVEGVWDNLKVSKLANFCATDPVNLMDVATGAGVAIQSDRDLLKGFVQHTGLPIRL